MIRPSPSGLSYALSILAPLAAVVVGCGTAADVGGGEASTFDPVGSTDGGAPSADGGGGIVVPPGACQLACSSGAFCSAAGGCIPSGTCRAKEDCEAGKTCDAPSQRCVLESACGAESAGAQIVAPNVLLVLDRSCSMTKLVGGRSKWSVAVDAVGAMTTTLAGRARFGLALFPDKQGDSCTQGQLAVAVAPGSEGPIRTLLQSSLATSDANYPSGPCVTNIDTGMKQAADEPTLTDPTRKSSVVLVTDGAQSSGCGAAGGDAGTERIIAALAQRGVKTYVVGFGSEVDAVQMNKFAIAGGAPVSDPTTKFFKAESAATLTAALRTIATSTLSCEFRLTKNPQDPSKVFVFFEGTTSVPRDPTRAQGWDYDARTNTVTFYGATCDALRSGQVQKVDVVLGCNAPIR
jgi:hypothetical protein